MFPLCLGAFRGLLPFLWWRILGAGSQRCLALRYVSFHGLCFTVRLSGHWFLFSFAVLYSRCVYSMSSLLGCHSSLGVSTVIMSSFGNALCGLSVHVGTRVVVFVRVHICTVCIHGNLTIAHYIVCVCDFLGVCACT